ncbi:hypothetical protein FRC04_004406 [Tulasnella sp. 424]|nr:hypothetical protein FRC04_004406 [Tulasnella sp. 424]KAG8979517.1 hypothetical protein FRC05_008506 [Tulasnella sp. 425]
MRKYLVHYSQAHDSFRLPELNSIAELHGFGQSMKVTLPDDLPDGGRNSSTPDDSKPSAPRPFVIVELELEAQARILAERCILVKAIYELWAHAPSYALLHELNQAPEARALWEPFKSIPFRMHVTAIHHAFPEGRVREVIQSFAYMDYERISLDKPGVVLFVCEEYELRIGMRNKSEGDGEFMQVYFGRLVTEGTARQLITKFDVKKRAYYGNTSMEAEMSLLMANQAQASPGKLIYDPFAGTGSMLYTCAFFGAMVFGSDIDGRQMRGKDASSLGIIRSAAQYGVADRILDCATFDITFNPWRRGGIFDAIVTDPPYGVRAGAKRIGSSVVGKPLSDVPRIVDGGIAAHTKPTYIPPMRPYEMSDLTMDLIEFARYMLKPGGRLVFFLPTVTEDYSELDVPECDGMKMVGNSIQDFGKWARRLITIEKTTTDNTAAKAPEFEDRAWRKREERAQLEPTDSNIHSDGKEEHVPAHRHFREKYFQGFRKEDSDVS